jgi:hypothetical protein
MTALLRIPPRARAALLVLLTAGVLAACGSDDEPPSVPNPDIAGATTEETTPDRGGSEELPEDDVDVGPTGPGLEDPGSGDFHLVPGPSGPGKAAFVEFADRVCTRFRGIIRRLRSTPGRRPGQLARLVGGATDRLSGPPAPAPGAGAFRGYLALLRTQRRLLDDLSDATDRRDRRAIVRVVRAVAKLSPRARSRARAYGLRVCGSS